ncbi:hypothetical protein D7V94_13440 [Parablautia intestinalis]|uniref:Uncharacterized protein n=1 Tax=Parablautia intestinalis TaxID=2320100 RepID=A0A3A9AFZ4_9FIRM|nr:hypothetical protein [Parablautia intestinalis]RKI90432.1 hypothetical protein D7V94_13440 [Parablautia intestinalis]
MNTARNISKMMEPKEASVGGNLFYIYPFPAFKSANISGEIAALLTPMLASLASVVGTGGEKHLMDMDIGEAAPHIVGAFSSLSGDKVEKLLRDLLLPGNIGVRTAAGVDPQFLTEDLSNEIFCGNTQDMFILAYHVIKVNYAGFFEKFGNLSGKVADMAQKMAFPGMAPLM